MITQRPRTPPDIEPTSPAALLRSRVTTTDDLDYLAKVAAGSPPIARMCVVDNPRTPLLVLLRLARDDDVNVRAYVARRCLTEKQQAPVEIIEALAADPDPAIRARLACYFLTPRHVVQQLACDEDAEVRRLVARRRDLPDEVIDSLSEDRNGRVRSEARYTKRERDASLDHRHRHAGRARQNSR